MSGPYCYGLRNQSDFLQLRKEQHAELAEKAQQEELSSLLPCIACLDRGCDDPLHVLVSLLIAVYAVVHLWACSTIVFSAFLLTTVL